MFFLTFHLFGSFYADTNFYNTYKLNNMIWRIRYTVPNKAAPLPEQKRVLHAWPPNFDYQQTMYNRKALHEYSISKKRVNFCRHFNLFFMQFFLFTFIFNFFPCTSFFFFFLIFHFFPSGLFPF